MPSSLADGYDCVVFDCDGVLWSGGETIAGAFATLDALERAGKKVYFMSNNSSRGLAEFRRVFEAHGLEKFVRDDARVWNSLTAARHWFEERGGGGAAYVVGAPALKAGVAAAGVRVVEPEPKRGAAPDELADMAIDPGVDSVVLGFDKNYGYFEVAYAVRCVLENGAKLVVTNRDFQFPAQRGLKMPGNGAFVAAVCAAARKEPDAVVAKPEPYVLRKIIEDAGCAPSRVLMVGDMWSDVVFAHGAGADAALVLSGVATAADGDAWTGAMAPDYVVADLTRLLDPAPPAAAHRLKRALAKLGAALPWSHVACVAAGVAIAALVGRRRS